MTLERFRPVPVLALLARPGEGAVERHSVKPGCHRGVPSKSRDGVPYLGDDFLEKIISIVRPESVSVDHLEQHPLVPSEPIVEDLFLVALLHEKLSCFAC